MADRWLPPIDEIAAAVMREAVSRVQTYGDLGIRELNYLALHAKCSTHGTIFVVRCEDEWERSDGMVICPHPDHVLAGVTRKVMPFAYSSATRPVGE